MKVLVACEYSAIVRDAFREKGHDAWSCDILPTEGDTRWHIQDDVLGVINGGWDMMVAHPPCTRLTNAGVRWLHERNLWEELGEACDFFNFLKNAPIEKIAVENPIPHKYAVEKIGKYDQVIQPWMFGDGETKAVCLWLKNLPPIIPLIAQKPENVTARVWRMPPGPDRQKERSRFFGGIANAMAEQWGSM